MYKTEKYVYYVFGIWHSLDKLYSCFNPPMAFNNTVARTLIRYVKKIDVRGNLFDITSLSAYEFARQMSSRHLKKSNPKLEVILENSDKPGGFLKVDFVNGSAYEADTTRYTAQELREEVLKLCDIIETQLDKAGDNPYAEAEDEGGKKSSSAKKK